jgi:PKD repeat protein
MLKSVRLFVIGLVLSVTAASAAFAQNHPMPGHKTAQPVVCAGCPETNSLGQPNDGLPTWPYGGALVKHVGRYVDSSSVQSYQMWANSYRTARARTIRPALTSRGAAPPRVYIQIGNGVGVYSLDTFFTSRLPGGMINISNRFGGAGSGREKFLDWDGFVYPEFNNSGWQIDGGDFQDPMSKGVPFDYDDRGYLYVATERFGWAITQDTGATTGNHLPKVIQYVSKPNPQYTKNLENKTGVSPEAIIAIKVGGTYYAVTATRDSSVAIFNVTTPASPSVHATRTADQRNGVRAMARSDSTSRLAYIDGAFRLHIYDYSTYISGGEPLYSETGVAFGKPDLGATISMDDSGAVWSVDTSGNVYKFTPNGSSYTKHVYTPFSARFQPIMLSVNAGYVAIGGIDMGENVYDLRLFRIEANGLTPVNIDNFFRNYYHSSPAGYAEPGPYTAIQAQSADVEIIKWGGKTYLLYSGFGLGDVFELEGGNSINIAVKGAPFGTPNPNAKSTESGPFYADPVTFVASSSSATTNYDVTWLFGNPEAGNAANSGRSRTGEEETHQYTGLTTAAAITAAKAVKAQAVQDPNILAQHNLVLKVPTPRVGLSPANTLFSANATGLDVVPTESFVDASDGAVEGHVAQWTIDSTTTNLKPNQAILVGGYGPRTMQFRGAYGAYDANLAVPTPYLTPALTLGYVVRPFRAQINTPTAQGNNVTFTASPYYYPTDVNGTWDVVWTVNGVAQSSGVSTSATGVAVGTIAPLTLPKSSFSDGTVVGLKINYDPTKLPAAAQAYAQFTTSSTLSAPDPLITVTGCTNVGSPCTLTASSASGKSIADWTFAWNVKLNGAGVKSGTGSSFVPGVSQVGNYTVDLVATKGIFDAPAQKQFTLAGSLCGPLPQSHTVSISKVGCSTSCAPGTTIEFAPSFLGYTKQACDSYSWNMGDGSAAKSGEVVNYSYANAGTYTVTLTMSNTGGGAAVQKTTTVNVNGGTVEPPPTNVCTIPTNIVVIASCNNSPCRTTDTVSFQARRGSAGLQSCDNVSWNFGDGTQSTSRTPTKQYSAANTYNVVATVTNTSGSSQGAYSLTIAAPPNANCGIAPALNHFVIEFVGATTNCRQSNGTSCNAGETVSFSAPNFFGYVVSNCDNFEWDFGDGTPKVNGRDVTHSFAGGQTYAVKLRVHNTTGQYIYGRNVTVTGSAPTEPLPVITSTTLPSTGVKGRTITFSATANVASNWIWNFGDGTAADSSQTNRTTSTITHTFATTGVKTVKVSARNAADAATAPTTDTQATITIADAPAIPEYKYLIPVAAYTAGSGGSAWRTDVQIYNSTSQPLQMDVTFKGRTQTLDMTKATHIYENFLGNLLSLWGMGDDSGPVVITTKSVTAPPQIWTRTYTTTANGTFGQFIPAIRIDNLGGGGAVDSGKYHISGLRHDERYRTNVGFLNPNATPVIATVTVFDERHFEKGTFQLTLQPFQLDQFQLAQRPELKDKLPKNAPFGLEISVPVGQWLVSYASYIDGMSNDPVYIQAVPESAVSSADYKSIILPGVGHTGQWRSDITIFNPDSKGMTFDLQYIDNAGTKRGEALGVTLEPSKFLTYSDLLKQGVLGNVADGLGLLKVSVTGTHEKYPITFARTYFDDIANGTYGQGISGFAAARANVKPNKSAIIAGVRNTAEYYTNLGLVNLGTSDVTVTVTLLDPTTGAAVNSIQYPIKPGETMVGRYNGWGVITQGTFKIEANGNVWAFASVIDNRTKDPEYVPALAIE